jgi:flagellar biosynthesis protein FliP
VNPALAALRLALAANADPGISLTVGGGGSAPVKLFLLFTALSFASALLVSVTSFTRIVIVLSFLRQALGTPQLPPNQVLIGLALVLSGFVMSPTATRVYDDALGPYLEDKIQPAAALDKASTPLMPAFMVSELTTSFRMGLFIYVPLLLVDLLVAAMLMSMGMMMVPPTMIALPLKIGIFLMADGWRLVVASLARSFGS